MNCPTCSTDLDPWTQVCPECGERLDRIVALPPLPADIQQRIIPLLIDGRREDALDVVREETGMPKDEAEDRVNQLCLLEDIEVPLRPGCVGTLLLMLVVAVILAMLCYCMTRHSH